MKKWIALFGYPMDNSVRAKVLDSKKDVAVELGQYREIRYFIAAFPVDEAMVYEDLETEASSVMQRCDRCGKDVFTSMFNDNGKHIGCLERLK